MPHGGWPGFRTCWKATWRSVKGCGDSHNILLYPEPAAGVLGVASIPLGWSQKVRSCYGTTHGFGLQLGDYERFGSDGTVLKYRDEPCWLRRGLI
jgi:hypothetical protein